MADKFTRRIVGWTVAERLTDELVITAFERAVTTGGASASAIVHTDRGSEVMCQ